MQLQDPRGAPEAVYGAPIRGGPIPFRSGSLFAVELDGSARARGMLLGASSVEKADGEARPCRPSQQGGNRHN